MQGSRIRGPLAPLPALVLAALFLAACGGSPRPHPASSVPPGGAGVGMQRTGVTVAAPSASK